MSAADDVRAVLADALDALTVAVPATKPQEVEPWHDKHDKPGATVLWWHRLPRPSVTNFGTTPLGVLTFDGSAGSGFVYLTQPEVRGVDYWPDITCITPDQARMLGHALLAAAQDADRSGDSVVRTFRAKGGNR